MHSSPLIEILKILPHNPGVYQYFDSEGNIIYVGKAKNLKKRVSSYFNRDLLENKKTIVLVNKIADLKYIVVENEQEALLLENTLIKKFQPKYNINLKDDKTYPWIVVTKEDFPRVFYTRKKNLKNCLYFGPYANVKTMFTLLDFIKKIYPVRSCTFQITPTLIAEKKFKVCLDYHIKNCKGPCEAYQTKEEYKKDIESIKEILRGNLSAVLKDLKKEMQELSEKYKFEEAQQVKDKIKSLEQYQSKSIVVSEVKGKVDVLSIIEEEKVAYVNYMMVSDGAIVHSHTIELKKKLDEETAELLSFALVEMRSTFESSADEVIVPIMLDISLDKVNITVPQRGDKLKLLELSQKNAFFFKKEKELRADLVDPERRTNELMQKMMKDLRLKEEPRRIECFDNSNFQGDYPVSAMPVFINGKPAKKEYRHFIVKTVKGANDFATMEEIIYRRYKRVMDENLEMPQLIIVDGGKGQLSAALKSLEKLGLLGKVGIIGIAKKLEEIYYPGDPYPLHLDKKSETLRVIQHIRDEAHRFGITFHRKRRSKGTIQSELDNIKGIGNATKTSLLRKFKSVKTIQTTTLDELTKAVGASKAKLIKDYFNFSH